MLGEEEAGGWWGLEIVRAVAGVTDSGMLQRLYKLFHKPKVAKPCWRGGVLNWRQTTDRTGSRDLSKNFAVARCTRRTGPFP